MRDVASAGFFFCFSPCNIQSNPWYTYHPPTQRLSDQSQPRLTAGLTRHRYRSHRGSARQDIAQEQRVGSAARDGLAAATLAAATVPDALLLSCACLRAHIDGNGMEAGSGARPTPMVGTRR